MKIAVTGSHGLIGSRLVPALEIAGHEVVRVVRGPANEPGTLSWDPAAGQIDVGALEGVDAVVHLAGVGIAAQRWTPAHKRAVLDSRVQGTTLIARTAASLDPQPVLLSASAIGYYGDRDDEVLSEDSASGSGFLAEVCRRWERSTAPASEAGVRTVLLRTGVVQAKEGGALGEQLPLFKAGLGARFGRGRQWVSWISADDEVGAIVALLDAETVSGPVNLTAPEPVTNAEYATTLGKVLGRPALLPAPPFAVKALLGAEMVSEMLLASQRVRPGVLDELGYVWRHRSLEEALRCELGRP